MLTAIITQRKLFNVRVNVSGHNLDSWKPLMGPRRYGFCPTTDRSLRKMGVTGAYIHAVLGLEGREGGKGVVVVARETAHG